MKNILSKLDFLFPEQKIFVRLWSWKQSIIIFSFLTVVFTIVGFFIPADELKQLPRNVQLRDFRQILEQRKANGNH